MPSLRRFGPLLLLVCGTARAGDAPPVAFEREPDGIRITIGGRSFARYIFGNDRTTRPFFEHLRTPGGIQVTRNNPPVEGRDLTDHPTFHPGLWLAFGDLNGADSWRNAERVCHAGFVEEPRGGPGRGTFAVRNRYAKGDTVLAEEVCRIAVLSRPEGTLLIWDSEFHPQVDQLIFGDQEEMGLGIRLATPLAVLNGGQIRDGQGRRDEAQVWGKTADWCAYLGEVDGKRVGIALIPDPANFRPCWFHARDYGLLAANPFGRNAFTGGEKSRVVVPRGRTLRLRFGVLIFDGTPDLDQAYRASLLPAAATRSK
jgi:hypothetical protein